MIAAISFAAIVSAQSATPVAKSSDKSAATTTTAVKPTPVTWYGCPKCDITAQKEGKCPKHNVTLIKDHSYFCPKCNMTADKAGKCTMDGTELVMMDCKSKMLNQRRGMQQAKTTTPASASPAAAPMKDNK